MPCWTTTAPTQPGPRCGPTDGPISIVWTFDGVEARALEELLPELVDVGVGAVEDRRPLERLRGQQLEDPLARLLAGPDPVRVLDDPVRGP